MIRTRLGKFAAVASALLFATLLALLVIPQVEHVIDRKVGEVISSLGDTVRDATGLELAYDAIALAPGGIIKGEAVRLVDPGDAETAPRNVLSIDALVVKLNLFAALGGKFDRVLQDISVEGGGLDLLLPRDAAIMDKLSSFLGGGKASSLPSFQVSLSSFRIGVQSPDAFSATVDIPSLRFSTASGIPEYVLDRSSYSVTLPLSPAAQPSLQAASQTGSSSGSSSAAPAGSASSARVLSGFLSLSGDAAKDFSSFRTELLADLSTGGLRLGEQRFGVRYEGGAGGAEGTIIAERKGGDGLGLTVRYGVTSGEVGIEAELTGFKPGSAVEVTGSGVWKELLGIGLTGKVEGGVTGGVVRYGGRLAATGEAGQEVGGVSVGGMGVEVAFEGDAEGMGRLEAAVRKDGWEGSYEGVVRYADLGVAGAVKVQHGTDGGVVRVDGGKGSYAISGDSLTFGTAELRDMNIRALLNGKSFDFSIDGRLWNGVSGAPLHAEIHSGSYEGFEGADFGIDLKEIDLATAFSLAKAFGVEGLPALPAGSILSANIFGQTDMKRLSWSAPEIALRIPLNGAEARIEASLAGNLSEARVKNLKIAYGGQEATLQGTATYGETVGFKGSLGFGGEQYALSVDYAEGMLNLTGDYGLFAQVAALENGGYGLTLEAEGLPVKVGTGRLVAGLKATGEYRSGTDWALHLAGVSARYEGSGTPLPELSGIAELSPGKAVFSRLALKGPGYGLTGPVVVGYGSGEGGDFLTIAGQFLKDDNEREKYQFDLRYSAGMVSGGAKVAGLPVERFQGVPVKGDLEADIAVEGAFDFATLDLGHLPAIRFTARLANGEYKSMPITASTSGSIDKGILTLENFAATYLGHSFENIGAEVSLTDRKASVHGTYKTVFGGERVSADLKVELACLGESDLVPFEFQGTLESLRISETILKDWGFSGGYSEEGLQFRGGEDSVVLVYRKDGEFDLSLAAPFPIKARAAGTLAGGNIDAAIAAIDFDLSQIGSLFSTGAIIVKKGRLGGDITMKGPIADPEINGSLIIKDAKIDIDQFVKVSAGPFDIPLVFSGKSVELGPNLMPFGGGSLDVSASAGLDHWKLLDISVAASSRASSTIDIDGSILGITVAGGKARVALDMAVEDGFLDIGGSLLLEKGEVMVGAGDANAAPANGESGAGEFRIRADIGFGRQVQFYLPSKDLPLVNGSADPSSALTLKFDSGSGALALDGTLSIKSGYILYYLRNFFIKRGEVRFAETEEKFDPRIDVTAELRESNEEGPVIITLETDNAPLSNLNPRLTSTPPMAQSQLLALLGGGILSTTSASGSLDVREAVIGSSEFIPQFNVFKAFESRVREALGVDMIYLRSTFLQRWLLDISKPAGSPDPEDPLASYLANTELYVGKYLSDSAFIHASVRLEEDPLVAASHLRLDSEVGIEFDSPWGMLTYSLSPSIGDAALVAGQALSLSWRISY